MSTSHKKPVVIGLYGLPGSGKSTMLNELRNRLGEEHFMFCEGAEVIEQLVGGGLEAFKKLSAADQYYYREAAITKMAEQCSKAGKVGLVTGHFSFQNEGHETRDPVWTAKDQQTYTHILYLDISADVISHRGRDDRTRTRPLTSVHFLSNWQQMEQEQLRTICYTNAILFSLVSRLDHVVKLMEDFRSHNEESNLFAAQELLDITVNNGLQDANSMLIFDADKTLAPDDTGALLWSAVEDGGNPLDQIFGSNLKYSYNAFRQAMLLYEEVATTYDFELLCKEVAESVAIYPEFVKLLQEVKCNPNVGALVITSGLRCLWEKVLQQHGLLDSVKVIGGGQIADGLL